jgi:hypothetical protein
LAINSNRGKFQISGENQDWNVSADHPERLDGHFAGLQLEQLAQQTPNGRFGDWNL